MTDKNVEGAEDHEALARDFIAKMAGGQHGQARGGFDEAMLSAMSEGALAELWSQLEAKLGQFEEATRSRKFSQGQYVVVLLRSRFGGNEVDLKLVFDASLKIAGLFILPPDDLHKWSQPTYVDPAAFSEREVKIGEQWQLPGTLTVPSGSGPHPAFVLVHGSGPNDRDETVGPNKPFKDLAWGLASRGIAVLRYDKRTLVHSARMAQMATMTVKEESVDDALEALALLRRTEGIDPERIFVLGHSLGATIIARIADRDRQLAGAIAMAPLGRTLEDTMVEQFEYIFAADGEVSESEAQKLVAIRAGRDKIKALKPSDQGGILGAPVSYWLDLKGFVPHEAAKGIEAPLLVLQGERDYQVTMVDFEMWKGALGTKEGVSFKSYPTLNHLFIAGEGNSVPGEYQTPGHVDEEVVKDIAAWASSHPRP